MCVRIFFYTHTYYAATFELNLPAAYANHDLMLRSIPDVGLHAAQFGGPATRQCVAPGLSACSAFSFIRS
mgnify:CR=1 FL=1